MKISTAFAKIIKIIIIVLKVCTQTRLKEWNVWVS